MAPMTNRVKVWRYSWGLIIETDNFTFEVKVILGLESNFLKSWAHGWTAGQKKPGIEAVASLKKVQTWDIVPSSATPPPSELETSLSEDL